MSQEIPSDGPPRITDDSQTGGHLEVRYSKGANFRVLHADGIYGGILPNLNIHMAFFVERGPLPNFVRYNISPEGMLIGEDESSKSIEQGIVREVETVVVFDINTAKSVFQWLKEKLDLAETLVNATQETPKEGQCQS
ncbi:MAG TPA: hypothetical protein VJX67_02285 [Blastocatellia bacterium]|nr:hypothetical protein [Blastocatellia bacterium]